MTETILSWQASETWAEEELTIKTYVNIWKQKKEPNGLHGGKYPVCHSLSDTMKKKQSTLKLKTDGILPGGMWNDAEMEICIILPYSIWLSTVHAVNTLANNHSNLTYTQTLLRTKANCSTQYWQTCTRTDNVNYKLNHIYSVL